MEIFIIRDGRQAGPYSEDAVKAFLTDGSSRPTDLGWRKGMADWRALSEVLKSQSEQPGESATPPAASASNGTTDTHVPATAKQKAFLKYLGAEFGENLTKERAALAVSDAMETPKLQTRIRKWQDDKLRQHPDIFQDEIDFRKANRSNRYLERLQTEGAEVVKDVTKAHVQVLVESLDKKHPGWESDRESALWDYLLPSVGDHFPQLVLPAHKDRLKASSTSRMPGAATRGMSAAGMMPPQPTGTLGAMMRGVALGVIALGAIVFGRQYWQQSHEKAAPPVASSPAVPGKNEAPAAKNEPAPKEPLVAAPEKMIAEAKAPDAAPGNPPAPAAPEPVPAPVPAEPAAPAPAAMNAEKPAAPAAPEEKPPTPATPPAEPAASNTPPAATPPAAPPPRTAVKLIQGIGVMLSNGQVTLPAGTPLRYLGTEGANVRVSWNNNIFFVPAMATDVNEPVPAPSEPGATPPAPGAQPAAPETPGAPKPKKPADDL